MNAKEPSTKQVLGDVFGSVNGETRFAGLIDSLDACDTRSSKTLDQSGIHFVLVFLSGLSRMKLNSFVRQ